MFSIVNTYSSYETQSEYSEMINSVATDATNQ